MNADIVNTLLNNLFLEGFSGNPGAVPDILQAYSGENAQHAIQGLIGSTLGSINNITQNSLNLQNNLAINTNSNISSNLASTEKQQRKMTNTALSDIKYLATTATNSINSFLDMTLQNIDKFGKESFKSVNSMFSKGTSEYQQTLQTLAGMQQTASQFTQPLTQESSTVALSPQCQAILNTSLSSFNASISTNTIPVGNVTKTLTVPYYTVNGMIPGSEVIGG